MYYSYYGSVVALQDPEFTKFWLSIARKIRWGHSKEFHHLATELYENTFNWFLPWDDEDFSDSGMDIEDAFAVLGEFTELRIDPALTVMPEMSGLRHQGRRKS